MDQKQKIRPTITGAVERLDPIGTSRLTHTRDLVGRNGSYRLLYMPKDTASKSTTTACCGLDSGEPDHGGGNIDYVM